MNAVLRVIRKISAPITKTPAVWLRVFAVAFFLHITFHAVLDGYQLLAWISAAVAALWIPDLILDYLRARKTRRAQKTR